jgi:hypothetical protein
MSIARHHAEWLNLIDISGPFLTIDVLTREFPQELDYNPYVRPELKSAYEEWREDQESYNPNSAIHNRWIGYVMDTVLEHQLEVNMGTGQAIPPDLKLVSREFGEVRPQIVVHNVDEPAQARMLVLAYPYNQSLERQVHGNASAASPATQMMELLHATDVRLGLVTNGEQWMLVYAKPGETTSFITWYADLWIKEALTLRAFISLLGIARFFMSEDKTLEALMAESASAQHEVTDQLGYQVREAVEILIQAIDRIDKARNRELLVDVNEDRLYEAALTVMMRLVFLMSAEERELLLLGDPIYDQHYAVTTLRAQLREVADLYGEEILARRFDAWSRLLAMFRAVHGGIQHENLRLPAYGGSLFDPDRFPFLEGRESGTHWSTSNAVPLSINNRTTLHLLEALQILRVKIPGGGMAEARRLSFRALSVTQIGHVYEGLLDHEARRADDYILGMTGTNHSEPEIALSELEDFDDRADLEKFLKDATGRSNISTIRRMLDGYLDAERARQLSIVCGTDDDLYNRVLPYLNLIRDDDRGRPYLVFPGGVYVTAGATRRATGTHYTPESLTIPIVKHTLEPLVYRGPAEGWDEADWQLKSPSELLELKICDMAMGSGAFLVQVVEYLSDRLLEAWEQTAQAEDKDKDITKIIPRVLPHGERSEGQLREEIITLDDRKTLAKRLVADRCIYGVDKNPLAVEMGKLSLWLITLSKGRAFTFLDHALKCGDSLVGVSIEQLRYWKLHPERNSDGEITEMEQMIGQRLQPIIDFAIEKRRQLESFTVMNLGDQQAKEQLHNEAEAATAYLKTAADHLIAETMGVSEGSVLADVVETFRALEGEADLIADLRDYPLTPPDGLDFLPFHWELEYPEVFQRGGFDAFVGNPPFIAGRFISGQIGEKYFSFLSDTFIGAKGQTDICAYFVRQAWQYSNLQSFTGLIATNSISQGDTRKSSLDFIINDNGIIYRAVASSRWPGSANVYISSIWLSHSGFQGDRFLNHTKVKEIDTTLGETMQMGAPEDLMPQVVGASKGTGLGGEYFLVDRSEIDKLQKVFRDRQLIKSYIIGRELMSLPEIEPLSYCIDFGDSNLEEAKEHSDILNYMQKILENTQKDPQKKLAGKWWRHRRSARGLYDQIDVLNLKRIIAKSQTTSTWAFVKLPVGWVYDQTLIVFVMQNEAYYSVLQSSLHEEWAWRYGSTLKTDLTYSPSRVFVNFPFPINFSYLEVIGERYHETRRKIMLNRQEGLTDIYNRFHESEEDAEDIQNLRDLHVEMDEAVASAYGWDDLDLGHDFHETAQGVRFTISEQARREVLTRLLKLNHERYAQECHEGLHKPKDCATFFAEHPEYQRKGKVDWDRMKKRKKVEDQPEQQELFDDDNPQKRLF